MSIGTGQFDRKGAKSVNFKLQPYAAFGYNVKAIMVMVVVVVVLVQFNLTRTWPECCLSVISCTVNKKNVNLLSSTLIIETKSLTSDKRFDCSMAPI